MMRADIDTLPKPIIEPGFTPSSNGHDHSDKQPDRAKYELFMKRKVSDAEWAEQLHDQAEFHRRKQETPQLSHDFEYLALTETENARYFGESIQGWVRYNVDLGVYMRHDGQRFIADRLGQVVRIAKLIANRTANLIVEPPGEFSSKDAVRHYVTSNKSTGISAILKLGQTEPGIPASSSDFDADPMLFNCLNATINLGTGKPRSHSAADLITKLAPVKYDAGADCLLPSAGTPSPSPH